MLTHIHQTTILQVCKTSCDSHTFFTHQTIILRVRRMSCESFIFALIKLRYHESVGRAANLLLSHIHRTTILQVHRTSCNSLTFFTHQTTILRVCRMSCESFRFPPRLCRVEILPSRLGLGFPQPDTNLYSLCPCWQKSCSHAVADTFQSSRQELGPCDCPD